MNIASNAFKASKAFPKKILIITYYWPPSGGAGVQRWLKFSKYLPLFDRQPFILTVDPGFAEYPAYDHSLISEINPDVRVYTTRATNYFNIFPGKKTGNREKLRISTNNKSLKNRVARFIRGNLFIPDPRKGWNRFALKKAVKLIEEEGINLIITSGPPHSSHLIGLSLKRKFSNIKWIADFRDPWTDIYYYNDFYASSLAKKKDKKYEYSVLDKADKILTVGYGMKELLELKLKSETDKIFVLPNGFDEEDFSISDDSKRFDTFTICYTGSISDRYPFESFLKAVSEITSSNSRQKFTLRFVGQLSEGAKNQIRNYKLLSISEFVEYSSHKETIGHIISSDMLLLLIPDHKYNDVIVTGKIFEYLRSGNTILGIGPVTGDAAKVLNETGAGKMFEPENTDGITDYLRNKLGKASYKIDDLTYNYERKHLTSKLVKLLDL